MRLGLRGAVVGAVIALHLLGLWALQAGLLQRVVTWVVPVMAVSEAVDVPVPPASATLEQQCFPVAM
jgi:protein TonB